MAALKQKVGNRDTKHGLLDLPVYTGAAMKKPKRGYQEGGFVDDDDPESQKVWRDSSDGGMEEVTRSAPVAAPVRVPVKKKAPARAYTPGEAMSEARRRGAFKNVKAFTPDEAMAEARRRGAVGFKKGGTVKCKDGCVVRGFTRAKGY